MSRKEAARTSVLSRRWIYLWLFSSGTLEFDNRDMIPLNFNGRNLATRDEIMKKKFIARVNRVLKLHPGFDGLIIRYTNLLPHSRLSRRPGYIDSWIYFAMQKEVKMFELNLSTYGNIHPYYEFPDLDMLLSSSPDVKFGFGSLRSLRLVGVDIKDEVVHYFLASCPYLEHLCIRGSRHTKDLQVVDPLPNLKFLEISGYFIRRLKVSATNLVSCTYEGCKIISPFEKIPNLSELTLGGHFAQSFIYEPNEHSSYSVQLVKLALNIPRELFFCLGHLRPSLPRLYSLKHLELNVTSSVGQSLHFFTSLIKASPLLNEFRIKISYMVTGPWGQGDGFPDVSPISARYQCRHTNLKVVKFSGYVGCSSDDTFLSRLLEIAPSLETLTIDTESEYYEQKSSHATMCNMKLKMGPCNCERQEGARTRNQAKMRAQLLKYSFPSKAVFIVT